MRKYISFLLIILLLLQFLNSCSEKIINLPDANYTVSIQKETFDDLYNTVTIQYPLISSDSIENLDEINDYLYDYIIQQYHHQGLASDAEDSYHYEITDVIVTLSTQNFISMIILGQYVGNESTHLEYISYSINYDLAHQKMIGIQSILKEFDDIKEEFLNHSFLFDFGDEEQVSTISVEDLMLQYRSEYGLYPCIYFREGYLCLLLELSHVAGGYAGYRINILKITDYLNNNDLCTFLTTDVG